MNKIQGRAHFVSFSSIIGSKIRSKCCKFCLRPDDFVLDTSDSTCLSDRGGNDTSKARNFHIWWISGFWSVPTQLGRLAATIMLALGSAKLLGFFLVDFAGSFALGFWDQYRSYDSKMTIKTLNEVRINSCRAILWLLSLRLLILRLVLMNVNGLFLCLSAMRNIAFTSKMLATNGEFR